MKKIRAFIIFALIPLIAGYFVASAQGHKKQIIVHLNFANNKLSSTDRIILTENGSIISLTQKEATTIPTQHPLLIEASPLSDNFIGVDKQTNYASLIEFSSTGSVIKTVQNGNTGNIDTMDWFTDPAINPNQQKIAFVSDKDKERTTVLDNALFIQNLNDGTVEKIADPDPHSGGIAHPLWNPADPDSITYDYYQYDQEYNPYSIIDTYNFRTKVTTPLTTQKQNAYQGSFSPDGKQFIFLERNNTITTIMELADVTANGLSNVREIATGDFAYPAFSYTPGYIYYLSAQGNNDYDLYMATITNGTISNPTPISTDGQLLGNSGFVVTEREK